jgi:serine/threonine-protein kinase
VSVGTEHSAILQARVGTTLAGKYRLDRVLGIGGMGAVFEAVNTWTERRVAIKVMIAQRVEGNDLAVRFLQEARAASKIAHPNIVDVLDMGQDPNDGTLYIVQEFLTGRDLRHILDDRGMLAPREAFEYLLPVMSALCAAHDRGIVHRDLKPENMFVTRSANGIVPKLIDFGIAKVVDGGRPVEKLTRPGETMGTPHYMSPEQARGERDTDAQTDIWAMGAVWFETLTGRCPFEGASYNELLAKILVDPVPSLAAIAPGLPPSIASAVQRALERDRSVRYTSMQKFLRTLLDAPELQKEEWMRALRTRYAELLGGEEFFDGPTALVPQTLAARSDGDATTKKLPADGVAPGQMSTTLRGTPREVDPGRPGVTRRVSTWTGVGLAAAALLAVTTTFAIRGRNHGTETPTRAPEHVAQPPVAVHVVIEPASADVTFDDVRRGHGPFDARIERDGHLHTLGIAAAGYEPWTITFSADAPPPAAIQLRPLPHDAPPSVPTPATQAGTAPRVVRNAPRTTTGLRPAQPPPANPATHAPPPPSSSPQLLRPHHGYP